MKPLYYSYLITLLLFIGVNDCFGQAQNQEVTPYTALYPFEENGLYGLMDSVGRVVIEAQFTEIIPRSSSKSESAIKYLNEYLLRRNKEHRENYNRLNAGHLPIKPYLVKRKEQTRKAPPSQNKLLILHSKNNVFHFLNEYELVRIDGKYGYINYKGEILLNANDSLKTVIRNSSSITWRLLEEKVRTKIELLHPNKYEYIKPVENYPHLIMVRKKIEEKYMWGLLKLDTQKNKTETIIPVNKKRIGLAWRGGVELLAVSDEQGTRYFNLKEETFYDKPKEKPKEKLKAKIERIYPNKYERLGQVSNYPNLIIASQKIEGTRKSGLLKYDALKNTIETIIPFNKNFNGICGDLLRVEDEQGFWLFKLSTETFLTPVFTRIDLAKNGFIPVQVNYKWGIIDTTGNWLYPPKLDTKPTFRKDLAYITGNEKNLYLLRNGQFTNGDFELKRKYGYQPDVYVFHSKGKYGIINMATNDTILAPIYDDFNPGYPRSWRSSTAVKIIKNKKAGLLNFAGKLIAPCIYTEIDEFLINRKDGRKFFKVNINNKLGLIDMEGNKIITPNYDEIKKVNNETIAFKKGEKWGYVYLKEDAPVHQKKTVSPKYTTIRGDKNIVYYTTNRKRKEKILKKISGEIIQYPEFSNETSESKTFILFRDAEELWGIRNSQTNKVIVPPTYRSYRKVNTDLVAFKNMGKWSVFDYRTGVFIHEDKFDHISESHPSRAFRIPFVNNNKWGFMDANGKIIFDAQAKHWERINKQGLFDVYIDDHFHQVDTTGRIVLATNFTRIYPRDNDGKKIVMFKTDSDLWGVADSNYQVIFDPQFESYGSFRRYVELRKQEKSYFLKPDFTLREIPSPPPNLGYESAYPISNRTMSNNYYFTVVKNNKTGLIDTLGREIIPPEYDNITVLYDTLALVGNGKKHSVLNLQTNTLEQSIIFDKIDWVGLGKHIPCFILKPRNAYINHQGEIVWKEEYFDFYDVETVLKVK